MKIKDIKKQLNQESSDITPDVLDRVKISPINRLRQNEKAMRVFKTTVASLILLLMATIVVILSVSIYAYMTQKPDLADENYTFVSVWVYEGEPLAGAGGGVNPPANQSHIRSFVVDGNFPTALLVCELVPGVLDGRKWMYIPSTAADCCEDTAAVEAFDATFPPKEKKWMPSQEEFYIYSHSSVVR